MNDPTRKIDQPLPRSARRVLLVWCAMLLGWTAITLAADNPGGNVGGGGGAEGGTRRIRLAYLVPRDRKPVDAYERKIRVIMELVADVYRQDLRDKGYRTDGLRFETAKDGAAPAVQLVRGERDAQYYNNAPRYDANAQWTRLLPEIRKNVGDPHRQVIVVFAETYDDGPAEHLWPGVIARGAYNTADGGLAVFSAHPLRDEFSAATADGLKRLISDRTPVPGRKAWGHAMNSARGEFVEDGIGAVTHELGHALGLPHDRRDDARDIMGNGFRNLRWNFSPQAAADKDKRARFSDDNARLLMSSRYLATDLRMTDDRPPKLEIPRPARERGGQWTVNVTASDESGLRAIVFVDRVAGTVIAGRKLSGPKQSFRQTLTAGDPKAERLQLQVIVTDDGGHQARTTVDSAAEP